MRIIKLICDGQPIEIFDDDGDSLEEKTMKLTEMMKSSKVTSIIGKKAAAVVRPGSISAINIIVDRSATENYDNETEDFRESETLKNIEQNIDRICDIED